MHTKAGGIGPQPPVDGLAQVRLQAVAADLVQQAQVVHGGRGERAACGGSGRRRGCASCGRRAVGLGLQDVAHGALVPADSFLCSVRNDEDASGAHQGASGPRQATSGRVLPRAEPITNLVVALAAVLVLVRCSNKEHGLRIARLGRLEVPSAQGFGAEGGACVSVPTRKRERGNTNAPERLGGVDLDREGAAAAADGIQGRKLELRRDGPLAVSRGSVRNGRPCSNQHGVQSHVHRLQRRNDDAPRRRRGGTRRAPPCTCCATRSRPPWPPP